LSSHTKKGNFLQVSGICTRSGRNWWCGIEIQDLTARVPKKIDMRTQSGEGKLKKMGEEKGEIIRIQAYLQQMKQGRGKRKC
jgi:hypothetical protein